MGLTIHWTLETRHQAKLEHVTKALERIRSKVTELPVNNVGPLISLNPQAAEKALNHSNTHDPARAFMMSSADHLEYNTSGRYSSVISVYPKQVVGFFVDIGDGCESLELFMAQYPSKVRTGTKNGKPVYVETGLNGWRGNSFCKTDYSHNFLRDHLSVISIFDACNKEGILKHVSDEGEYWNTRNLYTLASNHRNAREIIPSLANLSKEAENKSTTVECLLLGKHITDKSDSAKFHPKYKQITSHSTYISIPSTDQKILPEL